MSVRALLKYDAVQKIINHKLVWCSGKWFRPGYPEDTIDPNVRQYMRKMRNVLTTTEMEELKIGTCIWRENEIQSGVFGNLEDFRHYKFNFNKDATKFIRERGKYLVKCWEYDHLKLRIGKPVHGMDRWYRFIAYDDHKLLAPHALKYAQMLISQSGLEPESGWH
jgi:hypothetical protein